MTITHWLHWLLSKDALVAAGSVVVLLLRSWLLDRAVSNAERMTLAIERKLVKTERDGVEWLHYRDRAARLGHHPKHVLDCQDGRCLMVKKC